MSDSLLRDLLAELAGESLTEQRDNARAAAVALERRLSESERRRTELQLTVRSLRAELVDARRAAEADRARADAAILREATRCSGHPGPWQPSSRLSPVGVPLVIWGPALGLQHVQRDNYAASSRAELTYITADGREIKGRFPWVIK